LALADAAETSFDLLAFDFGALAGGDNDFDFSDFDSSLVFGGCRLSFHSF
jgi:hypothetical protein